MPKGSRRGTRIFRRSGSQIGFHPVELGSRWTEDRLEDIESDIFRQEINSSKPLVGCRDQRPKGNRGLGGPPKGIPFATSQLFFTLYGIKLDVADLCCCHRGGIMEHIRRRQASDRFR